MSSLRYSRESILTHTYSTNFDVNKLKKIVDSPLHFRHFLFTTRTELDRITVAITSNHSDILPSEIELLLCNYFTLLLDWKWNYEENGMEIGDGVSSNDLAFRNGLTTIPSSSFNHSSFRHNLSQPTRRILHFGSKGRLR